MKLKFIDNLQNTLINSLDIDLNSLKINKNDILVLESVRYEVINKELVFNKSILQEIIINCKKYE